MFDPNVTLRERNFYVVLIESVVDEFLHFGDIAVTLLHQDILLKGYVDAAVAEAVEGHRDAALGVDKRPVVFVFQLQVTSGFKK